MTIVQGSMSANDNVFREHRIVEDCVQKGNAKACIHDWAKIISELYYYGRGKPVKRSVTLQHAEKYALNGIWETSKDVPAYIWFVRETRNDGENYLGLLNEQVHRLYQRCTKRTVNEELENKI